VGARDFDKVLLSLPIPSCDSYNKLNRGISRATTHSEPVALVVQIDEGMLFISARKIICTALDEGGIMKNIDKTE